MLSETSRHSTVARLIVFTVLLIAFGACTKSDATHVARGWGKLTNAGATEEAIGYYSSSLWKTRGTSYLAMQNESITKHLREFRDTGKCLRAEHEPGSYHERTNGACAEVSLDMCDA